MQRLWNMLLTAIAPMLWGTTYIITTEWLPANRPLLVGVMRALPIGLIFLAWGRQLPKGIWWWRSLVLGALNIGFFFPLLFIAAYRLPGGIAATLGALQPFIVAFWGWIVLKERVTSRLLLMAGLGVLGVAMMLISPQAQLDAWGMLAAFGGAMLYGVGITLNKHWGRPVPLMTYTAWQLVVGGLMIVPIALLIEGMPPAFTPTNWLGFGLIGIVNTGIAYLFWFRGIERLPTTTMSFLILLSPVSATILGWLVLDQRLSLLQMLGALVVLASIIFSQMPNRKPAQRLQVVQRS
ncbi:EamA family transporter [Herpetosiphon giganteus]|uniref:EamA family transporter n=1 Tax=Herpetosiphon giganteus TaxID=2029754 RepID=UPI001EF785FA|nr:EamA family transporter [Herpetosiphon giganteus]MBM7846700.1 putative blue pigment (indigoidine) exporter [Herpetosiphon giganteus]